MLKKLTLCAMGTLLSLGSIAQELSSASIMDNVSVGLTAGTGGGGIEFSKALSDQFALRLGYSQGSFEHSFERRQIQYDTTLSLGGASILADYQPWKNTGFRLTGGAYFPDFAAQGSASLASGSLTINGTSYSLADVGALNADISFGSSLKPYLGLGYSKGNRTSGWSISADAGLIFTGTPQLSLTATCVSALSSVCTQLNQNVASERNKVQDSLDKLYLLPMLQMSVNYRF